MSVLRNPGRGAGTRHLLSLSAVVLSMMAGLGPIAAWAQEDAVVESNEIVEVANDLWSAVTERYEVVVLSRGLLLEPLDEGVELLTIEIVDNRVAIDGESVEEAELAAKVGDENAELVLQLAAMDRTERRQLFAGEEEIALAEPAEEPETDEVHREDDSDREPRKYRDSQVAVGSSLTVHEDEVANEAVVFGGPLFVYGKVAGDAVAIGGSVTVSGEVTGDVAAVGGSLVLEAGAEVLGDVVSVGGEVEIDENARVRGQIIEVPFGPNLRFGEWPRAIFGGGHGWRTDGDFFEMSPWGVATGFMWEAFKLIVLALFACLVMLVAGEPLARVKRRAASEPWKSGLVGLLVLILFAPLLVLVTLILVISIIGIPLILLVPFFVLALWLVAFLGYSGVALGIGEFLQERFGWQAKSPYLALLLGVLTIQVWSVIGDLLDVGWGPLWFFAVMFGIFGALVKFFAWTVGLGAAVLSRFGSADGWGGRGSAVYAPVVPAMPLTPEVQEPPTPEEPSVLRDLGFMDEEPLAENSESAENDDNQSPRGSET